MSNGSKELELVKSLSSTSRPGFGGKPDEELRVEVRSYNGKPFVSLRVWFKQGEKFLPGKAGCTIRMSELDAVITGLDKFLAESLESGAA